MGEQTNLLKAIRNDLKSLGIEADVVRFIDTYNIHIYFKSKIDMNLYKISGYFAEGNIIWFNIKFKIGELTRLEKVLKVFKRDL